jgi:alkylation response protein AidB-like acyl-CoA dehydrogenase
VILSTGLALGMADHAVEVFLGSITKRSIPYSPYAHQIDSPVSRHTLGKAVMQIRAAGRLAEAAVADLDRLDAEHRDPTERETLQFHTDAAYVWNECAAAIETLFRASGASAITKRLPMQLIARNCRAGSLHAANAVDTWLENLGRAMCGAEAGPSSTSVLERR